VIARRQATSFPRFVHGRVLAIEDVAFARVTLFPAASQMLPPRFLIIRRRYLGDLVLLGPLVRNLRMHYPDAKIAALAEFPHVEVAKLNPDIDETITLPRSDAPLRAWLHVLRTLRRARFSHVLDLDNATKTGFLSRITGAKTRIALLHELPARSPWLYTRLAIDPAEQHERRTVSEYYLQTLPALGLPIKNVPVRLIPRAEDLAEVRRWLEAQVPAGPKHRVLVHPGSRSSYRVWPAERFAAVIDQLNALEGIQVVLLGGPSDQSTVTDILGRVRTHVVTRPQPPSIAQFAAIASLCDITLCHDSGPMHVASAVGSTVVALFGSQNVALWRPPGNDHVVLQAEQPCLTCVDPGICVRDDSYRNLCVRRIAVDQVVAALTKKLT
jgi:predicted lipopolysaccharide heptosyltransferase III